MDKETVIRAIKEINEKCSERTAQAATKALELQVPKTVKVQMYSPAHCPTCDELLSVDLGDGYYDYHIGADRCPNCGQRIKWDYAENLGR